MLYNALVEDHFQRPRNPALADCPDSLEGAAGSVERGTWIAFQLRLGPDRAVRGARFRAYGCPHTIALASWLTEFLPGRVVAGNFTLDRQRVVQVLELPVEKTHCVIVAEDALRACVAHLEDSNGN